MVTRWKKEPHMGKHRTGLARARYTVSLCLLAGVFAQSSAVAATRSARRTLHSKSVNLGTSCTTDADCVDSNACLQGTCAEGICEFVERPDCLPCFGPPTCPPVEIVFLMDTSGSMVDEATAICENINQIVLDLAAGGMLITPHFLGITETPDEGFDCLNSDVVTMLGGEVPGDAASCSFPDTFSAHESWGPATAVVAERFPWGDAVVKMIVPISDEGPCDGSFPDGCVDPGNDRDSITNAITVANANDVIVSPISGTSSSVCVLTLASALATGTGGMAFASQDPHTDLADALIEIVSHVCEPAACDDGNFCTDDVCVNGICESTTIPDCCDLSETVCETNEDCPEGACNPVTGLCICLPTLCLEIDVESNDGNGCFEVGEEVLVHAVLGHSPPVNGGQFLVTYDPSVVEFIDAQPAHEVFVALAGTPELVQPGQVFYAIVPVIPTPAEPSVTGPVVVATFKFRVLAPCMSTDFCFMDKNPFNTFMMLFGKRVDVEFCCSELLSTSSGGPVLICPDSVSVNAEPGRLAATVTWDNVQVEPVCEGPVAVSCTAQRPDGVPIEHLIPNGGLFPSGHSTIECMGTDESCGGETICSWVVSVSSANTVVSELQFAPTVTPGPLHRCIEFEFFANCVEESEIIREDINFGLPYDLPGTAKQVFFKVAANKYICVTARDPLHSLRSVAETQIDGDHWLVRFQGDPSLGGNWLVGGNLDGNRVIDVLDLGYVRAHMGETLGAGTSCDRS
ncbi:MAG: hypothetical protein IH987_11305, partial [Planctomycetes bacterium]|nr:hypothetical protein [Planctomycetota bacterium]